MKLALIIFAVGLCACQVIAKSAPADLGPCVAKEQAICAERLGCQCQTDKDCTLSETKTPCDDMICNDAYLDSVNLRNPGMYWNTDECHDCIRCTISNDSTVTRSPVLTFANRNTVANGDTVGAIDSNAFDNLD
ncbi:hypothetical protein CAPTEDRAFT_196131 [Capitella teleta]|uniref:Uncharacterized protein n=1 Tax=Capitella teleta TaxID=283909 RepID=R7U8K9_CAPTE|nr:hypothetical protein CAPTEDRAFT_196131 [Capitella teleta]|eukprot:ELT99445.1 hypothetical protein CAPTEDRAFT_196131 [Capitella teleta]